MYDDNFITPAREIGIGVCPICLESLIVFQRESNVFAINPDGVPLLTLNSEDKSYLLCPTCAFRCNTVRNNGSFRPYIPHDKYIREDNIAKDFAALTNKVLKTINENYSNPFIKGDKSND